MLAFAWCKGEPAHVCLSTGAMRDRWLSRSEMVVLAAVLVEQDGDIPIVKTLERNLKEAVADRLDIVDYENMIRIGSLK